MLVRRYLLSKEPTIFRRAHDIAQQPVVLAKKGAKATSRILMAVITTLIA